MSPSRTVSAGQNRFTGVALAILWAGVAMGCGRPFATESKASAALTSHGLVRTNGAPQTLPPTQLAMFAAGCFWGVEAELRKVPGVLATAVGFAGGHTPNPTYRRVCEGDTGHAESVQVEFDPGVVSYDQLLVLFWDLHDPTTLNRQGPDVGEQYRSVIFYYSPQQKTAAIASRDKLARSGEIRGGIVTEIIPAGEFTKADEHHQQYVEKGGQAFCHRRRANPI